MPTDFHPWSRHRFLVLYDPAALPLDFPVDSDLTTPEPEPPPQTAVRSLSWEGRGFVIEVPQEEDCEASVRVFVNEQVPADLLNKGKRVANETRLTLPGGLLRAEGSEFMCLPGQKRTETEQEPVAKLLPGDYLLTVHELVNWKLEHGDRELRARSTFAARFTHRIVNSFGIICAVLLVAHILVVPVVLMFVWKQGGWRAAGKTGLIILAMDAVVYGFILLLALLEKKFPNLFGFSELRRQFDAEHPDFVVTLQRAEGRPGSGDTALFKWPEATPG